MKAYLFLDKTVSSIERILVILASIMVYFLGIVIFLNVLGRFFLGKGIAWSTDISGYLLVFIAFFVGPWLLKTNGHVYIDMFIDKAAGKVKAGLKLFSHLVIIAVTLLFAWFGLTTVIDNYQTNVMLMDVLQTKKYLIIIPIFFGSLIMFLRAVLMLWKETQFRNAEL